MKKTQKKRNRKEQIGEKEEKREEDKVGKETRALQVPCGSKHVATVRKTTDRRPPRKQQQIWVNEKDREEREG